MPESKEPQFRQHLVGLAQSALDNVPLRRARGRSAYYEALLPDGQHLSLEIRYHRIPRDRVEWWFESDHRRWIEGHYVVLGLYRENAAVDRPETVLVLPAEWLRERQTKLADRRDGGKDIRVKLAQHRYWLFYRMTGLNEDLSEFREAWSRLSSRQGAAARTSRTLAEEVEELPSQSELLEATARSCYVPEEFFQELVDLLRQRKQVILQGPPGTGKTWVARALAEYLAGDPGRWEIVQFHASYTYEDFVQGLRPETTGGQLTFAMREGIFLQVCRRAQADAKHNYVLIIDEFNRAQPSKVLGEVMYALEYRDQPVRLQYSSEHLQIPKNLYILATMNTADRSIRLVDYALRRRFAFVDFYPECGVPGSESYLPATPACEGVLERWLESKQLAELRPLRDVLRYVNGQIAIGRPTLGRHMALGHSYFMREAIVEAFHRGGLGSAIDTCARIWEHEIVPLLAEYFFDEPEGLDRLSRFGDLWETEASRGAHSGQARASRP